MRIEPLVVERLTTGPFPLPISPTMTFPPGTTFSVRILIGKDESKFSEDQVRRIINANFVERGPKKVTAVPARYLPGEESYIKTINDLEQSVTAQNASMSASSQVSYAKDIAVVDDSIKKMREVVKKNPRNQAARQVLYSTYQDKIDLLKASSGRSDMMASLQY